MNIYKLEKITNELNIYKQRLSKIYHYDNYKNYFEFECKNIQENKVEGIVKFIEGVKTIKKIPFRLVLSGGVELAPQGINFIQDKIIYNGIIFGKDYVKDLNKNEFYGTNNFYSSLRASCRNESSFIEWTNQFDKLAYLEGNNW